MECPLCGEREEETLDHFLRQCSGLRHIRARHGVREEDELVKMLLFSIQSTIKLRSGGNTWRRAGGRGWLRFKLEIGAEDAGR